MYTAPTIRVHFCIMSRLTFVCPGVQYGITYAAFLSGSSYCKTFSPKFRHHKIPLPELIMRCIWCFCPRFCDPTKPDAVYPIFPVCRQRSPAGDTGLCATDSVSQGDRGTGGSSVWTDIRFSHSGMGELEALDECSPSCQTVSLIRVRIHVQ